MFDPSGFASLNPATPSVSDVHNEVNAIMNGEAVLGTDGILRPSPQLEQAEGTIIGASGNEPVGTIKSVKHSDGIIRIWRRGPLRWTVVNSEYDVLTSDDKDDILNTMSDDTKTTKSKTASLIPNAATYLDNNFNVMLIGLHGTGKTVSVMELAAERGMKFKYFSCSTLDPYTDLVGVPTPRDYCPECKLYFKDSPTCPDCKGRTIESLRMVRPRDVDEAEFIFFDEFNRADSTTQNALFEIMQFKSINGEALPNLKACWAAINPPDDEQNYQVNQLDPAMLDRFDIYIEITPRPSVPYMSRRMPRPIAQALKLWWEAHQEALKRKAKSGKDDSTKSDYISPRRLEKIGIVWCATKAPRSVYSVLPQGGTFEKTKLIDMLKAAQKEVDRGLLDGVDYSEVEDEDDEMIDPDGQGLGDRPSDQFIYKLGNMRQDADAIAEYLTQYPMHYPTHEKIVEQFRIGVSGEELVMRFAKIINALNPSSLEGLVASFPSAKASQMRRGFVRLYELDPDTAKKYTNLYKVLDKGQAGTANWPRL